MLSPTQGFNTWGRSCLHATKRGRLRQKKSKKFLKVRDIETSIVENDLIRRVVRRQRLVISTFTRIVCASIVLVYSTYICALSGNDKAHKETFHCQAKDSTLLLVRMDTHLAFSAIESKWECASIRHSQSQWLFPGGWTFSFSWALTIGIANTMLTGHQRCVGCRRNFEGWLYFLSAMFF